MNVIGGPIDVNASPTGTPGTGSTGKFGPKVTGPPQAEPQDVSRLTEPPPRRPRGEFRERLENLGYDNPHVAAKDLGLDRAGIYEEWRGERAPSARAWRALERLESEAR